MLKFVITLLLLLWCLICYLVMNQIKKKVTEYKRTHYKSDKLEIKHRACPYCGHDCAVFYVPSQEREPQLYTCGDCLRKFGYASLMDETEKAELEKSDAACPPPEQIPELHDILYAVEQYIMHTPANRFKEKEIEIRNGEVNSIEYGNGSSRKWLRCAYQSRNSAIFDMHLVTLCIRYLKEKYPYPNFEYYYTGAGFCMKDTYRPE